MNKLYERPKGNVSEIIKRAAQQVGLLPIYGTDQKEFTALSNNNISQVELLNIINTSNSNKSKYLAASHQNLTNPIYLSNLSKAANAFVVAGIASNPNTDQRVLEAIFEGIEFTDRYDALGINPPSPNKVCKGQCEGTGWVPIRIEAETDPVFIALWKEAEILQPSANGYHFVQCPECHGTGKVPAEAPLQLRDVNVPQITDMLVLPHAPEVKKKNSPFFVHSYLEPGSDVMVQGGPYKGQLGVTEEMNLEKEEGSPLYDVDMSGEKQRIPEKDLWRRPMFYGSSGEMILEKLASNSNTPSYIKLKAQAYFFGPQKTSDNAQHDIWQVLDHLEQQGMAERDLKRYLNSLSDQEVMDAAAGTMGWEALSTFLKEYPEFKNAYPKGTLLVISGDWDPDEQNMPRGVGRRRALERLWDSWSERDLTERQESYQEEGRDLTLSSTQKFAMTTWKDMSMPQPRDGWQVRHNKTGLVMGVMAADEKGVYVEPVDEEGDKTAEGQLKELNMSNVVWEREGEFYIYAGDGFSTGNWTLYDSKGTPVLPYHQGYAAKKEDEAAEEAPADSVGSPHFHVCSNCGYRQDCKNPDCELDPGEEQSRQSCKFCKPEDGAYDLETEQADSAKGEGIMKVESLNLTKRAAGPIMNTSPESDGLYEPVTITFDVEKSMIQEYTKAGVKQLALSILGRYFSEEYFDPDFINELKIDLEHPGFESTFGD